MMFGTESTVDSSKKHEDTLLKERRKRKRERDRAINKTSVLIEQTFTD